MSIPHVAPLAVDPAALAVAGAAVVAIGDDLAAALGVLTGGFSANTGQDAAGEVFGLAYQDAAEALLKAAAGAINALRFNGAKVQLCASHDGGGDRDGPAHGGDHPTVVPPFSWDDRLALADYTGSGYEDLNRALRSDALDASHHARIDALNNALEKLPAYQGPVIRGTNLPPEVLDQYRPGEIITEDAFLSTTTNTAVARSPTFAGNVEFWIYPAQGEIFLPSRCSRAGKKYCFPLVLGSISLVRR